MSALDHKKDGIRAIGDRTDVRGYEIESERAVSRQFVAAEVRKVTGISEEIVCRRDTIER